METQETLFKGELMEELIRNYFLNAGFYVVRGVKFRYEGIDLTDIDLFLYDRSSSLTRQRINVDIKNKKSPQALERILWANGLMKILGFDSCIVATGDTRSLVQAFGQQHNTTVLDGTFLSKMKTNSFPDRLSEEELGNYLATFKNYKNPALKDWRMVYEHSKSKLLTELDFSGFNSCLEILTYLILEALADIKKGEPAIRMIFLVLSHLLIIIDFILKDIAFLETVQKEKKLSDGFKFGNLGKEGVDKILSIASQMAGGKSINSYLKSFDSIPTDVLKNFFSKNETAKNLFHWAKELEHLGYKKDFVNPNTIDPQLKGLISVILDYSYIDRRKFFEKFNTIESESLNQQDSKRKILGNPEHKDIDHGTAPNPDKK